MPASASIFAIHDHWVIFGDISCVFNLFLNITCVFWFVFLRVGLGLFHKCSPLRLLLGLNKVPYSSHIWGKRVDRAPELLNSKKLDANFELFNRHGNAKLLGENSAQSNAEPYIFPTLGSAQYILVLVLLKSCTWRVAHRQLSLTY